MSRFMRKADNIAAEAALDGLYIIMKKLRDYEWDFDAMHSYPGSQPAR